eukprot:scaffold1429_cov196-Alexandrium_tamarense.AAC.2
MLALSLASLYYLWVQTIFVLSDSSFGSCALIWPLLVCQLNYALIFSLPLIFPSANQFNRGKANCIQRLFSLWDICLSALMCCLGVFGIIDNPTSLPEIFVSVYMILFATLLFLFELMWWKSIDSVNKNLRMNFGFLYGIKGKAAYLIFVAFLAIGLRDDVSVKFLRWMTGGCFLGTGILLLFLHFTKPELLSSYKAPTAGFGGQRGGDVNTSV